MRNILFILAIVGCSNAERSALMAWGSQHEIVCYSGGKVIYAGTYTGKIENEAQSGGYYFQDSGTKKFVTVSGNCVITVKTKKGEK